ncbi:MAG: DNA repair protein RecO [Phototrophicales bacterium]|nr:MAG: DNA repair protein RecO [Phototrophicales bacterium]RMG77570.1 MAG: DNA repair protein RecO [Chloroflexota bacterium]
MARSQRTFRTQALIIRRRDFAEADRLLTIITPTHGKLDVIAKGARKPTSTKTGHVELFALVDMLISRGRNFHLVTQAELVEPYLNIREDLQRSAYASYVAELADRFTLQGEDDLTDVFNLLMYTLSYLSDTDDLRKVARFYELRLLDAVGFRPELNECVFTHEPIQPQDQFFSYAEGGVVVPSAAQYSHSLVPISLNTLKLLRYLQRSEYQQIQVLRIPPETHMEVERLMLGYITFLLERRLQSVDFIRRIRT